MVTGAPRPADLEPLADTLGFHRGLEGYQPTPLVDAKAIARELGLDRLLVKNESSRFGLPAFKFLGASWAIAQLLGGGSDLAQLRHAARDAGIRRLTTATDGNHGRAVARMAVALELDATIYAPASMAPVRRAAIVSEGANVFDVGGSYDDAVRAATADAKTDAGCRAVNDADLDGSSPAARWVIEGYSTLFAEVDNAIGGIDVDVVMLQTGVGAFAASGVRWAARHGAAAVAVDPAGAACVAVSLARSRPVTVKTTPTAMAGLDAGTPSAAAWPALWAGLAGAVVVSDEEADTAMRTLAGEGIESGESGAAGLAGLKALLRDPSCSPLLTAIGRPRSALVVVTEGATDPARYHGVVGE
jgi:diaminopropionate ammonia-lyase